MEELATVVTAVGHAGAVQGGMRPVQLLLSITLHEEVDGHHPCTLGNIDTLKNTMVTAMSYMSSKRFVDPSARVAMLLVLFVFLFVC